MDKKICNIIRDVLPLYIDDVVCPDSREWVDEHLNECPECAKIVEDMRVLPVLPANAGARMQNMDGMKKFRRFLNSRRVISALTAMVVSLAAVIGVICWLMLTVEEIKYDGSNIYIEEVENGYGLMLCYAGRGDILWGAGTVPATGETTIVVTQRLWDRYIDPIYDSSDPEYYLMESDRTLVIKMQDTGEVLWEADEDQAARFYERQARMKAENPEYFDE